MWEWREGAVVEWIGEDNSRWVPSAVSAIPSQLPAPSDVIRVRATGLSGPSHPDSKGQPAYIQLSNFASSLANLKGTEVLAKAGLAVESTMTSSPPIASWTALGVTRQSLTATQLGPTIVPRISGRQCRFRWKATASVPGRGIGRPRGLRHRFRPDRFADPAALYRLQMPECARSVDHRDQPRSQRVAGPAPRLPHHDRRGRRRALTARRDWSVRGPRGSSSGRGSDRLGIQPADQRRSG